MNEKRNGAVTETHIVPALASFKDVALIAWLTAGNRLMLHGWRKLKGRWAVNERELKLEDVLTKNRTEA